MKIDLGGIGHIDTDINKIVYKADFLFKAKTQYGLGDLDRIHEIVKSLLKKRYEQ